GFIFAPNATASEVRLTFAQLECQARAVAGVLQGRGLAGQPALLCYPAGVAFRVGLFGCLYAGMIAVPAYPPRASRADGRLGRISDNAGASLVLTTANAVRDKARLCSHAPALGEMPWLDTTSIPDGHARDWSDLE